MDEMHIGSTAFDETGLKRSRTELASNPLPRQTMLRLDERQRAVIADKLPDMANLVTAAIVIGFSIGEPAATMRLVVVTMAVWAVAFIVAVIISRGTQ